MEDEAKLVARMFNSMAGLNGVASSSVFSSAVGGLRNLMTSAMLGTSVLTATSDQAIMRANAQALGFTRGGMRLSVNTIKNLFSGDAKRRMLNSVCWWIHMLLWFRKWAGLTCLAA